MMKRHTLAAVCLTAALTATLAACTSAPSHDPAPTPTSDADTRLDFHGGHEITPDTPAIWDETAETSALEAATNTMTAYLAHEGVTRDEWWAQLAPHLDVIATRDYAWVEPASIPASRITGPITVTPGVAPTLATAEIPTDIGTYTLTLSRKDGAAPWEAGRITPPEGVR